MPATTIRSWVRGGRLHPEFDGVYAVGHPLTTREERWLAAVIACGEGAVLSHQSAGVHRGFLVAEGKDIDVTAARGRKNQRGIRVHRPRNPPSWTLHRGIPTTTIAQTLLDLLDGLIALRYTWADLTRRRAKVTAGCSRAFALARGRAWSAASRTR